MSNAIYPGSFDPPTNGHLDLVKRASMLFDKVIVGVLNNSAKTPLFSVDERVNMLRRATEDLENVEVRAFSGLTVDFAIECDAKAIVRGLRAVTDYEYELQLAQTNRVLCREIDSVFLTTSLEYAYLSSTIVKEVASYGEDITRFVPDFIAEAIKEKFKDR
jgi:pantetheine-phosphate adenylyltransferase